MEVIESVPYLDYSHASMEVVEPGQSINDYYDQLRFIWNQIDLFDPTWACSKDAQQYTSIRDEFRHYEFLMSLHKDFEPI